MKFEIQTEQFSRAARIISIVATREAFPMESAHVLISTEGKGIGFSATDRESRVKLMLNDVQVTEPGELTFYVPTLKTLSARLVGETVSVHRPPESSRVTFSSGLFRGEMNLISPEDLKEIGLPAPENTAKFEMAAFSAALGQVCPVAAGEKSASHRSLSDVKMIGQSNSLDVIACDGHRLAIRRLKCDLVGPFSFDVSVPARSLQKLRGVLREMGDEEVSVGTTENEVIVSGRTWQMGCLLSSLAYPTTYRAMVPSRSRTKALVGREALRDAVRRSSCLGLADESFPRAIGISFRPDRLSLEATNEIGSGVEDVAADVEGSDLTIILSANHMEQGLEVLECQRVRLHANGPREQLLVTADVPDVDFKYIMMPRVR